MGIFSVIGNEVTKAVDYVVEKNRKAAMINRLRIVIKNERENTARAYVALGKYYMEHLRNPEDAQAEQLCKAVEESEARMRKACLLYTSSKIADRPRPPRKRRALFARAQALAKAYIPGRGPWEGRPGTRSFAVLYGRRWLQSPRRACRRRWRASGKSRPAGFSLPVRTEGSRALPVKCFSSVSLPKK